MSVAVRLTNTGSAPVEVYVTSDSEGSPYLLLGEPLLTDHTVFATLQDGECLQVKETAS